MAASVGTESMSSHIRVELTDGVMGINVSLEHSGLGDDEVPALCDAIASIARTAVPGEKGAIPVNLAVEMNFISAKGLNTLLTTWMAWLGGGVPMLRRLHLRRLRGHMNRIDDLGAEVLAAYITAVPSDFLPHEIHLSHNRITAPGAIALLRACAGRYPRSGFKGFPTPLWLRLEHNQIDCRALAAASAGSGLRYCTCPKPVHGGGGGSRRGQGQHKGPRCGPGLCLVTAALQSKTQGLNLRADPDMTRPGMSHHLPSWHPKAVQAHCPFLGEQRPTTTGTVHVDALALRPLKRRESDIPAPAHVQAQEEKGDASAALDMARLTGARDELYGEGAPQVGGGEEGGERDAVPTPAPIPAVQVHTRDTRTPDTPTPSPVYLVLDTSAVLHMMPGHAPAGAGHAFTFAALGLCPANAQALWKSGAFTPRGTATDGTAAFVLLETVLQQLDDNKKPAGSDGGAASRTRASVNAFMRLYPLLEEAGALVRLAGEDAEDQVRSGGMHVSTRPGLRGLDGRFDSDGLIVDASLVLLRGLLEAHARDASVGGGGQPPIAVLVTCDIRMRNRAREARLPSVLLDELSHGWARGGGLPPLTRTSLCAALPIDVMRLVEAASGEGVRGAGVLVGGERGEAPPSVLAGRVPYVELAAAASLVDSMAALLSVYASTHTGEGGRVGGGGAFGCVCPTCESSAVLLHIAASSSHMWRAMHDSKRQSSSLHAALYRDRRGPAPVQGLSQLPAPAPKAAQGEVSRVATLVEGKRAPGKGKGTTVVALTAPPATDSNASDDEDDSDEEALDRLMGNLGITTSEGTLEGKLGVEDEDEEDEDEEEEDEDEGDEDDSSIDPHFTFAGLDLDEQSELDESDLSSDELALLIGSKGHGGGGARLAKEGMGLRMGVLPASSLRAQPKGRGGTGRGGAGLARRGGGGGGRGGHHAHAMRAASRGGRGGRAGATLAGAPGVPHAASRVGRGPRGRPPVHEIYDDQE